jgi:hypothetical protein
MSDRKILFWEHAPGQRPQDFVRHDIPRGKREQLATVLKHGRRGLQYRGWAQPSKGSRGSAQRRRIACLRTNLTPSGLRFAS